MQLVQLQNAQKRFEEQGLKLAAVSYDSTDILKDFAKRQSITYPLLADPESAAISQFRALNAKASGMTKGMSQPGFVVIDKDGVVKESVFDPEYTNRYTGGSILARLFPELVEGQGRDIEAEHLKLSLEQSDPVASPGSRVTLTARIKLPPKVHVYAPEVKNYKPIQLELEPQPDFKLNPAVFPKSKILLLPVIKESVPVYSGEFRISQDITIAATRDLIKSLGAGKTITVKGKLNYQACDDKICYLPASIPVSWEVRLTQVDLQRSPEAIQHREAGK